jgi:tetratricopeptide (TPR) repeat protein
MMRNCFNVAVVVLVLLAASSWAQKSAHCPDGDHILIDVKDISIKYDASSFAGTLSSLSVLTGRPEVAPKQLQEAAVATQQWNEFLKGLATGYNMCAITKQQYADGLNRIYPRLKEDGAGLEEIRKQIAAGQKADTKRLQQLIDSFYANVRQFAQASRSEIILQRIQALSEQVATSQGQILQKEDLILAKLNELQQQAPLPTPTEVNKEISEVRKQLLAQADVAEPAYNKGYELLNQYRFREAIPYLQQALAAVPLPDFYLVLGRAYRELPDLPQAESTLKQGLTAIAGKKEERREAALADQLGLTLLAKGDLDGALKHAQEALEIAEKVYGPDDPFVAICANNIGQILQAKGDLDGALLYTQRALQIDEKVYGADYPTVAIISNNIGVILRSKGDLDGALNYAQRALQIDEKAYGPDHPNVATIANNISVILLAEGDLDGALMYAKRALQIDEKAYGPEHPSVAGDANNIGWILKSKGDLDGALRYTQRALQISEKVYGPSHPNVAISADNIGQILKSKGDLDGALTYAKRALQIDERDYGMDNPEVAICADNIGQILKARGDLDGALKYAHLAWQIDNKVYGPNNPMTRRLAANLKLIEQARAAKEH